MKIVFFGTPEYVVPVLDRLHKALKTKLGESPIVAVVTQPPKPTGRKQQLEYSAVDAWAHKKDIPIYFKAEDLIRDGVKAEVAVLESYGNILNRNVIEYFPKGIINIHPSLLPKWRGASPVPAALIAGDTVTGGTAIRLDEQVDHGPIISSFNVEVLANDTTETLRGRIFEMASDFLVKLMPAYLDGKINLKNQDDKLATFTTRIKKEDAFITPEAIDTAFEGKELKKRWSIHFIKDFSVQPTPVVLERFIRAMQPWPGAWTYVQINPKSQTQNPNRLKIIKAHIETVSSKQSAVNSEILILDEVQLEGKNPVSWKQFKEAYPEAKFE